MVGAPLPQEMTGQMRRSSRPPCWPQPPPAQGQRLRGAHPRTIQPQQSAGGTRGETTGHQIRCDVAIDRHAI